MMESSCKNPVSPVDAVSISMSTLSLPKASSDESIWPPRNCMAQTIELKSDSNCNSIKRSSFVESKHILDPSTIENEDVTNSNICDNGFGSSYTSNSDNKYVLGESSRECYNEPSEITKVLNSSIHQMTLRPRTVSPRHCIITLYDDSESEESSDSDYTVDLDKCDFTSSDEETDSCVEGWSSDDDSLHPELAIEEMSLSTGESSDSDEVTTESSSSSGEETDNQTKESSDSEEQTADSSGSDEETELPAKESSDSEEQTASSSDEDAELPTKESSDSDDESSSSDEETGPPTKQSSDSDEESSRSDEEKELPTKESSDSDEDATESSSHYEGSREHPTKKSSNSVRKESLQSEDSEEECNTSLTESRNFNEDQVTSEDDSSEFSRNQLNEYPCLVSKLHESGNDDSDSCDSDSSVTSNSNQSTYDSETTTDDKSISLGESTEYSSEESNASG